MKYVSLQEKQIPPYIHLESSICALFHYYQIFVCLVPQIEDRF
jgi:hypothetical protein